MAAELARVPWGVKAELAAGLWPRDNTLRSPLRTGDGSRCAGADLTHPRLPLILGQDWHRAESRCSQRSGEMSLTHSLGSNWVRLSPEAMERTASGEADPSLVKIQVLLRLRELLALGERQGRARLSNSGHWVAVQNNLFSPGLSNSFDLKGANTWRNRRAG